MKASDLVLSGLSSSTGRTQPAHALIKFCLQATLSEVYWGGNGLRATMKLTEHGLRLDVPHLSLI